MTRARVATGRFGIMGKFDRLLYKMYGLVVDVVISIAKIATTILLKTAGDDGNICFSTPIDKDRKNKNIAMLVPIIPDVSHTFIYREILAMEKHGAKFDVIGILQGDMSFIHPEADQLLKETRFVKEICFLRYVFLYLQFLFLMPKNFSRMLSYFRIHCNEDEYMLLRRAQAANLLHPLRCLSLAKMLKNSGATSIHAYGFSFPSTMALGASILLDIPFSISTYVDFEHDYPYKLLPQKLTAAQFVVVVTNYCKKRLLTLAGPPFADKIHVIHSSIDAGYCDGVEKAKHPDIVRIISVARFVEKKGIDFLIDACGILHSKGYNFECVLVGNGPDQQKYEVLIDHLQLGDKVKIVPPMENNLIRPLYGRDTIAAMPCVNASDGERDGIPNALLEAMMCGSPAVTTTISGMPELINSGENGILVPEKDAAGLADALEQLIISEDLRQRLAERGQYTIKTSFNLDEKAKFRLQLVYS